MTADKKQPQTDKQSKPATPGATTGQKPPPPGGFVPALVAILWEHRVGRFAVVAGGVVVVGFALWKVLYTPTPDQCPGDFPSKPKVVSVGPQGEFGELHFQGLKSALESAGGHVHLDRISAPFSQFKACRIKEELDRLASELQSGNVVSVVAPSTSECVQPVLDVVKRSGCDIPVIIESSSPRDALDWSHPPLFRLSSGVDKRGREVARLIKRVLASGNSVVLLVEQVPNKSSYGDFLHVQMRKSEVLTAEEYQKLDVLKFPRGDIKSKQTFLDAAAARSRTLIVLFGVGDDFAQLARAYFVHSKKETTKASIVGVMNAYKFPDLKTNEDPIMFSRLYEITDLDWTPALGAAPSHVQFMVDYLNKYGAITPAHRDQAFSYDAGLLLRNALKDLPDNLDYTAGLKTVAERLRKVELAGVTGQVKFSDAMPGQSKATNRLRLAQYVPEAPPPHWVALNEHALNQRLTKRE